MEKNTENREAKTDEGIPEWEKPQVTEFDVNSTTLAGTGGSRWDGTAYS